MESSPGQSWPHWPGAGGGRSLLSLNLPKGRKTSPGEGQVQRGSPLGRSSTATAGSVPHASWNPKRGFFGCQNQHCPRRERTQQPETLHKAALNKAQVGALSSPPPPIPKACGAGRLQVTRRKRKSHLAVLILALCAWQAGSVGLTFSADAALGPGP